MSIVIVLILRYPAKDYRVEDSNVVLLVTFATPQMFLHMFIFGTLYDDYLIQNVTACCEA